MNKSQNKKLIAITGGIGSGKSVVSEIFRAMGYEVFDCDSEAKKIMDIDDEIKEFLIKEISAESIDSQGVIDRKLVARIVFAEKKLLERLNSVTHRKVIEEFKRFACKSDKSLVFVETAILYSSGMRNLVDAVIEVTADQEVRIKRVINRSNLTREQIEARMATQRNEIPEDENNIYFINNNPDQAVMPQIIKILDRLS